MLMQIRLLTLTAGSLLSAAADASEQEISGPEASTGPAYAAVTGMEKIVNELFI